MNYNEAIKGHYEGIQSSNALRNSVGMATNLDAAFERFKVSVKGGHYAQTMADNGSFKENKFHVPRKINRDELPNGRPLWQMELSKVVPAPTNYDVKREFSDVRPDKSGACGFGHGFSRYRKTCDINKDIQIFETSTNPINPGMLKPSVQTTKKHVPTVGIGKAK